MNKLNIGLFGFGCVGSGLWQILQDRPDFPAQIKHICVKHLGKHQEAEIQHLLTTDAEDILNDESVNVIVELIDDADAAFQLVRRALSKGKAVVTANKKMLAEHLEELYLLQRQYNTPLLYEGACCASIPIIRSLEEYYAFDGLQQIEGIFNGSTNFILTRMFEEEKSFGEALQEAQLNGFAESDPTLDIEAFDPKYKLCVVLLHAFGIFVRPEQVVHYGIQQVSEEDVRYAKRRGMRIKLLASCERVGEELVVYCAPRFVNGNSRLTEVHDELNGVYVESDFAAEQFFVGRGAGSRPTGAAVLSDLSALVQKYRYPYHKYQQKQPLQLSEDLWVDVYIRYDDAAKIRWEDLKEVKEQYQEGKWNYLLGKICLRSLRESAWLRASGISLILH